MAATAEEHRLRDARRGVPWRKWGPYLSARQWGTVREDVSDDGDAWSSFPHDHARSRTYRWGEDGLFGWCDDHGLVCLALALWNEADPILKERLFGLTNGEGNHGEDVKEYWFHLDAVPSHAYQTLRYKYPTTAFPYAELVDVNRERTRLDYEYELLDTGVFDDDRYVDVDVTYAKASPEDTLLRIDVTNRGPEPAAVHVLPTLWFRDTWSVPPHDARPSARLDGGSVAVEHPRVGRYRFAVDGDGEWLFCENATNTQRLWGQANTTPYPKDGIHDHVVHGAPTVDPALAGTKCAARRRVVVAPGATATVRARLWAGAAGDPWATFDATVARRAAEADEFHRALVPAGLDPARATVMRRALAGMLWTKQHYVFDVAQWLRERGVDRRAPPPGCGRDAAWGHLDADDVISMPDGWEYPWFASWDLAFHTVALGMIDPDFAKAQLALVLGSRYLHPAGQVPAYEWDFGAVNPPVQAWAALLTHGAGSRTGAADLAFLREVFDKLLVDFTWWVNRKDPSGRNVFEAGFLGLDNIGVFDRSTALPGGGRLEQADGTAWMALLSQNMLELALVLGAHEAGYEDLVLVFVRHFFAIAAAADPGGDGGDQLWDEEDGFFYDVLRLPDGTGLRIKVRSLVGLLPLCAVTVVEPDALARHPRLTARIQTLLEADPDVRAAVADPGRVGVAGRRLLAILDERKLRRVLAHVLDEDQFLSPHGIRSLSRWHRDHPYTFDVDGTSYRVDYEPAESTTGMFGGNSNWRGPVWFPVNVLVIRALLQYHRYYGDDFRIDCPTGSGRTCTLFEVARELADRLVSLFVPGPDGRRPCFGATTRFATDPHWRDLVQFHEYFNGDDGAGLGASHQTGWTGLVARLVQMFAHLSGDDLVHGPPRPLGVPFVAVAVDPEPAPTRVPSP